MVVWYYSISHRSSGVPSLANHNDDQQPLSAQHPFNSSTVIRVGQPEVVHHRAQNRRSSSELPPASTQNKSQLSITVIWCSTPPFDWGERNQWSLLQRISVCSSQIPEPPSSIPGKCFKATRLPRARDSELQNRLQRSTSCRNPPACRRAGGSDWKVLFLFLFLVCTCFCSWLVLVPLSAHFCFVWIKVPPCPPRTCTSTMYLYLYLLL